MDCLIVDDIVDTAGTLVKGAEALMNHGARSVRAAATHGVLSYDKKEKISALDKIAKSPLTELIVSDSIPQEQNIRNCGNKSKLKVMTVAPLLANAIKAINGNGSISKLFE